MLIIASPVAFTTGFRLFSDWYKQRQQSQILEQEKLEAELKYLHAQINPHFLFNTLNNLYGLSLERSAKVPSLILKLSDLLSYSLYETKRKYVDVQSEIQLIHNFIDLEKERYEDRIDVEFQITGAETPFKMAPLLLMPLAENAFKHSLREEITQAKIKLSLQIKYRELQFTVSNSIPDDSGSYTVTEGIGLKNLQRRLDLMYPDAHKLTAKIEAGNYVAFLSVENYV